MSKTIGQRLKEIREKKELTTYEVSEKCGILQPRISFYEQDKGIPTIPILKRLAEGLNCTIFDIIDEPLGRNLSMCIHKDICPFYQRIFKAQN